MLALAAPYADIWNTAWLASPEELAEPLGKLRKACAQVGRDPNTLTITANIAVAFPNLGESSPFFQNALQGSVNDLSQAFQDFAESGAAHQIIQPTPASLPAVERIMEAVRLFRDEI
jgi:alkanesulfonate monooxygenase SsuD/methylene tetrahydromethanopterin reductase-like flavin-dependent oxidoreductase (luciferase family)